MSLPYLPNEIWIMIFNNLDVDDKISCRKVCIKFYNLLDDIDKLLYEKFGSLSGILIFALTNKKMDLFESYKDKITFDEIVENDLCLLIAIINQGLENEFKFYLEKFPDLKKVKKMHDLFEHICHVDAVYIADPFTDFMKYDEDYIIDELGKIMVDNNAPEVFIHYFSAYDDYIDNILEFRYNGINTYIERIVINGNNKFFYKIYDKFKHRFDDIDEWDRSSLIMFTGMYGDYELFEFIRVKLNATYKNCPYVDISAMISYSINNDINITRSLFTKFGLGRCAIYRIAPNLSSIIRSMVLDILDDEELIIKICNPDLIDICDIKNSEFDLFRLANDNGKEKLYNYLINTFK